MAERNVRFYRLFGAQDQPIPDIAVDDVLKVVEALPQKDAYVQLARMELLGSTYRPKGAGAKAEVSMLILDRITREVRMRIEKNRTYRPLQLSPGETLAEPTHFGFFPNNVVGVLRANANSPSASSLRDYLNTALELTEPINIKPLADANATRALADVDRITKVQVAWGPDANPEDFGGDARLFGSILRQTRQRVGAVEVELIVKVRRTDATDAPELVLQDLREVVNSAGRQSVTKAKMTYKDIDDGHSEAFDFLNQAVATSTDVDIAEGTAGPTDKSAAQGLASAYNDLYDDIQHAIDQSGGTVGG